MSNHASPPRLLPDVIGAIIDLGTPKTMKIVDFIRPTYPRTRNLRVQVRHALHYALDSGVLKEEGGKFRLHLEMAKRQHRDSPAPDSMCPNCRRNKKRPRRKSSKKYRRGNRRIEILEERSKRRGRPRRIGKQVNNDGNDDADDDEEEENHYNDRKGDGGINSQDNNNNNNNRIIDEDDDNKNSNDDENHDDGVLPENFGPECGNRDCLCSVTKHVDDENTNQID